MSFLFPWMLLGLLAIPVGYWLSRRKQRRQSAQVGSLLIWQLVADEQALEGKRGIDRLLLFVMAVIFLIIFAAAQPQFHHGASTPDVAILIDDGIGGAILDLSSSEASDFGLPEELHERFDKAKNTPDPSSTLTPERMRAWMVSNPAAKHVVISPMKLGDMPPSAKHIVPEFESESLALERLVIEGRDLFARTTRKNSRFEILHSEGTRQVALGKGNDVLHRLPPTSKGASLRLQRVDDKTGSRKADAPSYLLEARPPLRLFAKGLAKTYLDALVESFEGSMVLVENAADADFLFGAFEKASSKPSLRVVTSGEKLIPHPQEIDGIAADSTRALPSWLGHGWLTTFPEFALPAKPGKDLFGTYSSAGDLALIQFESLNSLVTTIDLLKTHRDSEWLALFVAAAIFECTGRDLIQESQWSLVPLGDVRLKEGGRENWFAPDSSDLAKPNQPAIGEIPLKVKRLDLAWVFHLSALMVFALMFWVERRLLLGIEPKVPIQK